MYSSFASLGHTDHFAKGAEGGRRNPTPPDSGERRHPRIVPTLHIALLDQAEEFSLAQEREFQAEARELVLPRLGPRDVEVIQDPVVQLSVVIELQGA